MRRDLPEFRDGSVDNDIAVGNDSVYAVVRRFAGKASVVLANLTDATVSCAVAVAGDAAYDIWGDRPVDLSDLELGPYGVAVVTIRSG